LSSVDDHQRCHFPGEWGGGQGEKMPCERASQLFSGCGKEKLGEKSKKARYKENKRKSRPTGEEKGRGLQLKRGHAAWGKKKGT